MRYCAVLSLVCAAVASGAIFEMSGRIEPPYRATVTLFGSTTPYTNSVLSDIRGRFRFAGLQPGAYTVSVFVPGRGEIRRTVEVGAGTADPNGRLELTMQFEETKATPDRGKVSARDLSIPRSAVKEYEAAQKVLSKRDVGKAIQHLEKAVGIAPGFAQAWNNLGTIAYHNDRYEDAERYFRKGLEADPSAYEPLVNLGGVLINLNRLDEAYTYNLHAALTRPNDALANAQLGMTYAGLGKPKLAEKYLLEATRLDPAHFSHPQLLLAEIYLREKRLSEAADQLDSFLAIHPDWPEARQVREGIARLRGGSVPH